MNRPRYLVFFSAVALAAHAALTAHAAHYDVLLRGGRVLDGSSTP